MLEKLRAAKEIKAKSGDDWGREDFNLCSRSINCRFAMMLTTAINGSSPN